MGIVQGLTEFLPVSSSGHLVIVPYLFGWDDPFITSLGFSVMLHLGTLVALLIYFREDWVRLIPAGLATIRDRSFRDDPDRRLAWLLVAATIPAAIAGLLFGDLIETTFRAVEVVVVMLVVGRHPAGRRGPRRRHVAPDRGCHVPGRRRHRRRPGPGAHPRDQPLGHLHLGRPPRRSGSRVCRPVQLPDGHADHGRCGAVRGAPACSAARPGVDVAIAPLVVGMVAALVSGLAAIHFMLRYLRTRSLDIFVAYRFGLAALVVVVLVARG